MDRKVFFQFEIIITCLSQLYPLYMNTYVMGLRGHYKYFNSFGQILTYKLVAPRAERVNGII